MMSDQTDPLNPMQGYPMRTFIARGCALVAAPLLCLLSCGDPATAPDVRSSTETNFLHVTYDYPKLATTEVSFWAVKGRAASVELWYHARPGASDSTKFIDFQVGANALDRRPDGSAIATGDSVLITLKVTDATHMVIDYQPSGLRFADADQPLLRMYWVACGDDLNYDGKVDAADDAIASQLNIWRQEGTGQPWYKQSSAVTKPTKEVSARLGGFSGYAIMF
jgi:hypothetical protein